ncbi:plasmid partition protein ParG [Blastopirellula marina]|uniref:plasmid partition protein ParG n=1 Tax=Blastopirellula marina TaxID=124 RepID=UPI0003190886|nr:plasmid partition protein ParG [Blastopirellula marina]
MSKQIKMAVRPQAKPQADDWVENRSPEPMPEPRKKTKRLTLDMDQDLYTRLKIHCARHQCRISDLVRLLVAVEVGPPQDGTCE